MAWIELLLAASGGILIGSFLNVVIYRGPALWGLIDTDFPRGSLAAPRSYCPACRTPIARWALIPVFGYLVLGGKCSSCGARISLQYPLVEIAGGLAAALSVLAFGMSWAALAGAIFLWSLIALAVIDFKTGYLPDALTLPLILLGLALSFTGWFASPIEAITGAVIGYGAFALIGVVFRHLRQIDGLGLGDAKLLAAIGAWAGAFALPLTIFAASLIALSGRPHCAASWTIDRPPHRDPLRPGARSRRRRDVAHQSARPGRHALNC